MPPVLAETLEAVGAIHEAVDNGQRKPPRRNLSAVRRGACVTGRRQRISTEPTKRQCSVQRHHQRLRLPTENDEERAAVAIGWQGRERRSARVAPRPALQWSGPTASPVGGPRATSRDSLTANVERSPSASHEKLRSNSARYPGWQAWWTTRCPRWLACLVQDFATRTVHRRVRDARAALAATTNGTRQGSRTLRRSARGCAGKCTQRSRARPAKYDRLRPVGVRIQYHPAYWFTWCASNSIGQDFLLDTVRQEKEIPMSPETRALGKIFDAVLLA